MPHLTKYKKEWINPPYNVLSYASTIPIEENDRVWCLNYILTKLLSIFDMTHSIKTNGFVEVIN